MLWPIGALLAAFGLSSAPTAQAHVKWFSDFDFLTPPLRVAEVVSPTYLVLLALTALFIASLVLVDRRLMDDVNSAVVEGVDRRGPFLCLLDRPAGGEDPDQCQRRGASRRGARRPGSPHRGRPRGHCCPFWSFHASYRMRSVMTGLPFSCDSMFSSVTSMYMK